MNNKKAIDIQRTPTVKYVEDITDLLSSNCPVALLEIGTMVRKIKMPAIIVSKAGG